MEASVHFFQNQGMKIYIGKLGLEDLHSSSGFIIKKEN
jgi:hypothetical protein